MFPLDSLAYKQAEIFHPQTFDQYQANVRRQQELVDDCSYSKNPSLQVRMEAILKYGGHFEFGAFIIAPVEPLAPKNLYLEQKITPLGLLEADRN